MYKPEDKENYNENANNEYDKRNNAYSDEHGDDDYEYVNEHSHSSYNDEYYD